MIICTTGMPGAGKTEAAKMLKEEGFILVEMSDPIRDMMIAQGLEINNKSFRDFAVELKRTKGMDIAAKINADRIDFGSNTVISGVRNIEEIRYFKSRCPDLIVVELYAPPETRFQRLVARWQDGLKTYDEFLYRERREIDMGMSSAIKMADIRIDNVGTLNDLKKGIRALIESRNSGVQKSVAKDFDKEEEE